MVGTNYHLLNFFNILFIVLFMVFKVSRNLPMLAWIKWLVPVDYHFFFHFIIYI